MPTYTEIVSGGVVAAGIALAALRYTPTAAGGVAAGGSASLAMTGAVGGGNAGILFVPLVGTSGHCGCNAYTITPDGGGIVGGSATVTDTTMRLGGGAVCGGSATAEIVQDPWDGIVFVLPLNEEGAGVADEYQDRSRHQFHGTGGNGNVDFTPEIDDGVFCQPSQHLDGVRYISTPADGIDEAQGFTVSLWGRLEEFHLGFRSFFSRGHATAEDDWVFQIGHNVLNQLTATVQTTDEDEPEQEAAGETMLDLERWYHLAATWEPGVGLKVFVNGVLDGELEVASTALMPLGNGGYIGRWNDAGVPVGNLQDVRLHPSVKSADWLRAEYENVCSDFYIVGGEETPVLG